MENNNSALQNDKALPLHDGLTVLFAIVIFALSYLFVRWIFFCELGLGAFIFTMAICVYISVYAITRVKKNSIPMRTFIEAMLIEVTVVAGGTLYFTSDNQYIKPIILLYSIFAILYWFYLIYGNRESTTINDFFFLDMVKAVFVMPFGSFGSVFTVLAGKKKNGSKSVIVYILVGLLIAILPTVVVAGLLLSGDSIFEGFIGSIFENITSKFLEIIVYVILSIPVSMYIFGAMYSCSNKRFNGILTNVNKQKVIAGVKGIPVILICTAETPMLIIYTIYFISHIGYYLSAFKNIVPEGYSTANYAREGFFQLCVVAFINMAWIIVASTFSKEKEGKRSAATKVYNIIVSVMTLALIATAIRKMFLYIDIYGLTQLRIITTCFLLFLTVLFIAVIIRQFYKKINVSAIAVVTAVLMIFSFAFSDMDSIIADYNIKAYMAGKLNELDIDMFADDLSLSVLPYVIKLADSEDPEIATQAKSYLTKKANELNGNEVFYEEYGYTIESMVDRRLAALNVPRLKAAKLLEAAGYGKIDCIE